MNPLKLLMQKMTFIAFLTLLLWSCKKNEAQPTNPAPNKEALTTKNIAVHPVLALSQVDQLRVRSLPDLESHVIVELAEGDTLFYLHQRTLETTELVLRGQTLNQPWLKVRTTNGLEGWVFGGAIALKE